MPSLLNKPDKRGTNLKSMLERGKNTINLLHARRNIHAIHNDSLLYQNIVNEEPMIVRLHQLGLLELHLE